ncbi:uncharacterized protein LOC118438647 [Folsomia candida]|nr:uncharacterized protein LOC118438647 [Folsomia candida]
MHDIAKGLEYLHEKKIIHRDLKPENVVLLTKGSYTVVKICDFGLAVIQSDGDYGSLTSHVGTSGYASPEMDGGKYTDSVDIYALGVIITEIYAACNSTLEDATGIFLSYLMESENYPLHPVQFQLQFPHLLTPQEAILPTLMTSPDPELRPSAKTVLSHLFSMYAGPSLIELHKPQPYYDYTPEKLQINGTPQQFLTSTEIIPIAIHKKLIPLLVTKVVLRHVKMDPSSIMEMVKPFKNLEYFFVHGENMNPDQVSFFKSAVKIADHHNKGPDWYLAPDLNPHPNLKHFTFHQLNYSDSLLNYAVLKRLMLTNVMFFIPWPYNMNHLVRNRMHIDIKFGTDLIVNINPEKDHFYINGEASSNLISLLVNIPFKTVEINNLNPKFTLADLMEQQNLIRNGNYILPPVEVSLDGLSKIHLRKLVLTNTTVNLLGNGLFFESFENLEELEFEGEQFCITANSRRPFEFIHIPKKLKSLKLAFVNILPPSELWVSQIPSVITLEYLQFTQCYFPPQFEEMLLDYFNVESLSISNNDLKQRPNFNWLWSLRKMRNLKKLMLYEFEWIDGADGIQDFVQDTILPVFKSYKIPTDCANLEFSRSFDILQKHPNFSFSVSQISLDEIHKELRKKDPVAKEDTLITDGLCFVPSFSVPGYQQVDDKLDLASPSQYYFDGDSENMWKLPKDQIQFPPPKKLKDKKVKEIVIKNATIGNIALQLMGCNLLESLFLENVVWTAQTKIKTDLVSLKVFKYFERYLVVGNMDRLSCDKLNDILFFSKDGYTNFWKRDINIVISLSDQLNVILNHDLGEVTVQSVKQADDLLVKLGIQTESVSSLILNNCNLPHNLIPSHLTSLNIRHVDDVLFEHLVTPPNRFPNLKNLYYEAHRNNVQDLDMSQIPQNLENLLIGGMSVTTLASVTCKNLSFSNCTFCPEFFQSYPQFLKVEKLIFFGGPTRTPNAEEVSSLIEDKNLIWVAFILFDPSDEHTIVYDRENKQKLKTFIESEEEREKFTRIINWLKSRAEFWNRENENRLSFGSKQFLLQRNTVQDEWKCVMDKRDEYFLYPEVKKLSGRDKLVL